MRSILIKKLKLLVAISIMLMMMMMMGSTSADEGEDKIDSTSACGGGNRGNGICLDQSLCCSKAGYCGTTEAHCDGVVRELEKEVETEKNNEKKLPSMTKPVEFSEDKEDDDEEEEAGVGTLSITNTLADTNTDDMCLLELIEDVGNKSKGEIVTFQRGESYGAYLSNRNRCDEPQNYPCYCNPDLYNQIECPYCSFYTGGSGIRGSGADGKLLCAKHQESVSFFVPGADGDVKTCSCFIPDDPTELPIEECTISNQLNDSGNNDDEDEAVASIQNNQDEDEDENEDEVNESCVVNDSKTGDIVTTIENGESFDEYVIGICGPSEEWPAYCNNNNNGKGDDNEPSKIARTIGTEEEEIQKLNTTSFLSVSNKDFFYVNEQYDVTVSGGIEYPYCIYDDVQSGRPICSKSKDQVVYTNKDGQRLRCSCLYLSYLMGGAQSTCSPYLDEILDEEKEDDTPQVVQEVEKEKDNQENLPSTEKPSTKEPTKKPTMKPTSKPTIFIAPTIQTFPPNFGNPFSNLNDQGTTSGGSREIVGTTMMITGSVILIGTILLGLVFLVEGLSL